MLGRKKRGWKRNEREEADEEFDSFTTSKGEYGSRVESGGDSERKKEEKMVVQGRGRERERERDLGAEHAGENEKRRENGRAEQTDRVSFSVGGFYFDSRLCEPISM